MQRVTLNASGAKVLSIFLSDDPPVDYSSTRGVPQYFFFYQLFRNHLRKEMI